MRLFSPAPDDRIRHLQVQTLYKHGPVIFGANYLNSVLIVLVLWFGGVDQRILSGWLAGLIILTTIRLIIARMYWHDPERQQRITHWQRLFTITTIFSGLMWGAAGYLFLLPEGGIYEAFLLVVLLGIGAGAASFMSSHLPTFYSFLSLLIFPLMARVLMVGDMPHMVMGGMMGVFYFVLVFMARNVNQILLESMLQRFDNLELVDKITSEKEAAEKANLAKSKFLAAASHDLRQPLHALTLLSGALAERTESEEAKNIVKRIRAAVVALENLFNALIDISKLDSGVMQPQITELSVRALFERIENDHRPEAENKGLEFVVSDCRDTTVMSDDILLERILRNFVSNAVRYTDSGSVRLDCRDDGEYVNIVVSDTGIGIPADMQDTIFDEYFQLDNPKRSQSTGVGLGLAIVARIARLIEHEVKVESLEGEGSAFSVRVPRGYRYAAKVEPPQETLTTGYRQDLQDITVLIIDNERAILEALEVLLGGWGCRVLLAETIEQARIELWGNDSPPDAVISEYHLRDNIDGWDAIKAIDAIVGRQVPAILITGDTGVAIGQEEEHGYRVLHKPVQPARLRAFLTHVQSLKAAQD